MLGFGLIERLGTLAIAAALLFAALRVHGSTSRHSRITKPAGVVLAFTAGLSFLATIVGEWALGWPPVAGMFAAAGIICAAVILVVDWFFDKKPDKPAFWAAFVLPLLLVLGSSSMAKVGDQVGAGDQKVAQVSHPTTKK